MRIARGLSRPGEGSGRESRPPVPLPDSAEASRRISVTTGVIIARLVLTTVRSVSSKRGAGRCSRRSLGESNCPGTVVKSSGQMRAKCLDRAPFSLQQKTVIFAHWLKREGAANLLKDEKEPYANSCPHVVQRA